MVGFRFSGVEDGKLRKSVSDALKISLPGDNRRSHRAQRASDMETERTPPPSARRITRTAAAGADAPPGAGGPQPESSWRRRVPPRRLLEASLDGTSPPPRSPARPHSSESPRGRLAPRSKQPPAELPAAPGPAAEAAGADVAAAAASEGAPDAAREAEAVAIETGGPTRGDIDALADVVQGIGARYAAVEEAISKLLASGATPGVTPAGPPPPPQPGRQQRPASTADVTAQPQEEASPARRSVAYVAPGADQGSVDSAVADFFASARLDASHVEGAEFVKLLAHVSRFALEAEAAYRPPSAEWMRGRLPDAERELLVSSGHGLHAALPPARARRSTP